MAGVPSIECGDIVYRALSRSADRHPDTGQPVTAAFIRRPAPRDANGLSINHHCDVEHCKNSLGKCYGVVSLHPGSLRSIGLDVIADKPQHGNITGLPRGKTMKLPRSVSHQCWFGKPGWLGRAPSVLEVEIPEKKTLHASNSVLA